MLEAGNRQEIWTHTRRWRQKGERIALVPTMGKLHAGHLALVAAAGKQAERVVTSIYVNPAQFGEGEDFEAYPRTLEEDRAALEQAGCDLLFTPGTQTIYPSGLDNAVLLTAPPDLATVLEGQFRPGHFDGVVTVVARLFNLVRPQVAVFGEKDYQQLLVIQRMVEDLAYDIQIQAIPTVREESGLAMSSRNAYLDSERLEMASKLQTVLRSVSTRASSSDTEYSVLEEAASRELEERGLKVEYLAIRRAADLGLPLPADRELRLLAAAWCGDTRLIDNLKLNLPENKIPI